MAGCRESRPSIHGDRGGVPPGTLMQRGTPTPMGAGSPERSLWFLLVTKRACSRLEGQNKRAKDGQQQWSDPGLIARKSLAVKRCLK